MPDDQHSCCGAPENGPAAIERALRGRQFWSPALEALYLCQRGPSRRAAIARTTMICGLLFIGAGVIDALDGQAMFWRGLPWRLAVLALAVCCSICLRGWAFAFLAARAELAMILAPQLAIMMVTEYIGEYGGRWADRYMMAAVFSVAAFIATTPLTHRMARVVCVAMILAYPVVPLLLPYAAPLAANLDMPVFATGVLAASLLVAGRNEQARRASFLLRRRHEIAAAELNVMNAELLRLSTVDPLTGLKNRRAFTAALQSNWQDRRQSLALAIFDVDWFKAFNDSAGHAAGDAALQAVAGAAERAVRHGVDLVARIGGEEFAVIMPGITEDQVRALAERLRCEVSALDLPHPGRPGRTLTISVGVACCTHADRLCQTPDAFMNEADAALYAAKAEGRDCVMLAKSVSRVSVR